MPKYKYLGIHLSDTLDWKMHKAYVEQRTADAADSARRSSICHMRPRQASYVWNSLVRTCAEYALDVWCDPDDEWEELECIQVDMGRAILRIDRASGHEFVRGELGWMRLATRRRISRLRYLWRLLTMEPTRWPARLFRLNLDLDADEFLQDDWFDQAFFRSMSAARDTWTAATLKLVGQLELDGELVRLHKRYLATQAIEAEAERLQRQADLRTTWDTVVHAALKQRDEARWQAAIRKDKRLRQYAALYTGSVPSGLDDPILQRQLVCTKQIWTMEEYLHTEDVYARRQQTLLRYGGQHLEVSCGRRRHIEREARVCQVCRHRIALAAADELGANEEPAVEDERHVVLECPLYSQERARWTKLLSDYALHEAQWLSGCLAPASKLGLAMGIIPDGMRSTLKQRKVVMSYCRHFLTTAMRRRERLLASLPKPRSGRSEVVDREPQPMVDEQASAAALARAVDLADVADHEINIADRNMLLTPGVDVEDPLAHVHMVDSDDEPDGVGARNVEADQHVHVHAHVDAEGLVQIIVQWSAYVQ